MPVAPLNREKGNGTEEGGDLMSPAGTSRNPAKQENELAEFHSDALIFFGATGDLAYKQIFPAFQVLIRRSHLNVPIIGVAKSGWSLDRLRERARRPC